MQSTRRSPAKVFIVDDHPLFRRGLAEVINQEEDLEVCGEAEDAAEALEAIERVKPDLLIVDLSLKGRSGLDVIKAIRARTHKRPILVLSMHDESLYASRALRAGARGYLMKSEATEKVGEAVRRVLHGDIVLSEAMTARMLESVSTGSQTKPDTPLSRLSDRELEVFQLIGQGLSTREIAQRLYLSVKTIETYRAHVMEKLSLHSAAELVRWAVQQS